IAFALCACEVLQGYAQVAITLRGWQRLRFPYGVLSATWTGVRHIELGDPGAFQVIDAQLERVPGMAKRPQAAVHNNLVVRLVRLGRQWLERARTRLSHAAKGGQSAASC